MDTAPRFDEYLAEIRNRVCSRCVEHPPGGPPCLPLGKECGVETHLIAYLQAIREIDSPVIDPYLDRIHDEVCSHCSQLGSEDCPCPMEYLIGLLVEAIETVDERHPEWAPHMTVSSA